MANRIQSTPKKDGYHMPGEFEYHNGCWMVWPERSDNWRLGAKPAQKAFADVASAISEFEMVTVAVSESQYSAAREALPERVRVVEISSDDAWVRDSGPTFVVNEQDHKVRGVDWNFNAWGGLVDGLYFPWDKDDKVARKICEIEDIDSYRTDGFVLEGGSIHTDGEGTLIVTKECLLSDGRNPDLTQKEIEEVLSDYLNIEKVLWVPRGIFNDETNGHVDNIIHYCGPGKIVLAWTDDVTDPQYEISNEAFKYLEKQTDAKGRSFEITKLHIPDPIIITQAESEGVDSVDGTLPRVEGDRMAASYANFYIANGGAVVPLFGDTVHDKEAVETLQRLFPNRKIVGVYAREIILGGGNIHCITQQQPAI